MTSFRGAASAAGLALALLSISVGANAHAAPYVSQLAAGDVAPYPGDPESEARLVAIEDKRIVEIENLIGTARRERLSQDSPYRLATGTIPTLVLVQRESPYTLPELAKLAPRTVVQDTDGAYVISENVVVAEGATLRIRSDDGLTVKLTSGPGTFVSLIALGGSLIIEGDPDFPVRITSWDPLAGVEDLDTADGRAYVRILAGQAALSNASFSNLGFWSGVTGGLSFTGTDTAIDSDSATSLQEFPEASGTDLENEILPADGGLETLPLEAETDVYGYSSALIQSVTLSDNAFGLFVTKSDRVEVRNTLIERSLVDGLVFHRDVTNSSVTNSVASDNAGDGFRITRATSSVLFEQLTASGNGRNGISLEGGPLADGPSAIGASTTVYGNNRVLGCTSTDNGRYGIEIVGGANLVIAGNTISRNVMGIVVSASASAVVIKDNEIRDSLKQGIVLRDAGLDATITGNTVLGGDIGIYLRDAGGAIERNTIDDVHNHGVTLIGATGSSTIVDNHVGGAGPSAIDVVRTTGTAVRDNDYEDWHNTKPLAVVLQGIFQPLTIVWLLIGAVLLIASIARIRRASGIRDPFASHAPLSTMTRGIVPRERAGAPA